MVGHKSYLHEEDKGGENGGKEAEGREIEGEEVKAKKMSVEKSAKERVNEQCRENKVDAPNTTYLVTICVIRLRTLRWQQSWLFLALIRIVI